MTLQDTVKRLHEAFPDVILSDGSNLRILAQDGSNRIYGRVTLPDGSTLIATIGSNKDENIAFISIAEALHKANINVPVIKRVSDDGLCYLQTDLGDKSLYDVLGETRIEGGYTPETLELLKHVMRDLARIHWVASEYVDFTKCFPVEAMSQRDIMWDLNYFKYCFLKPFGIEVDEVGLENDFVKLTDYILQCVAGQPREVFMYRDFQSRNVLVQHGVPGYIDFQGGRKGFYLYDLISFIWQARVTYPYLVKGAMLNAYFEEAERCGVNIDREEAYTQLRYVQLFRRLQTLGTYGFRGKIEGKQKFISSIPKVVASILEMVDLQPEYPAIFEALNKIQTILDEQRDQNADDGLTVTVISFSYHKGYPTDSRGNGGGFIFDCRAIHNPGRYEEYKSLTGMDEPVQQFLDKDGEIDALLKSAIQQVDTSVDKYLSRGFNSLQVGFGCTGGQHRSVYAAEKMAKHLAERGDVRVRLIHREQGVDKTI